jgi:hypothetical protein
VEIKVTELTNFSDLVWTAPEGKPVYGYNVLVRETSSSHWEKTIFVQNTSVTIPYSKDNFLFAIQSVDVLGHASLPVFPIPVK